MSLLTRLAVQAAKGFGALSSSNKVSVDYLVVAGGGGGGGGFDGGGAGAGGYQTSTATLSTLTTYTITVGSGGAGGITATGTSGVASSISGTGLTTITSTGGGGGGGGGGAVGLTGGSGGGGSRGSAGGTGTSGQGNNGVAGIASTPTVGAGGGGGGASAVGANATSGVGGAGGAGTASSISGSSVTYAGGGGGSTNSGTTNGAGGSGGGGAGVIGSTGTAGTANLGGGGGGAGQAFTGGSGGSGVVIISYTSATPKFVGGTITTSGGKQIHTFTSTGSLNPITPITASYLVVAGGGGGGGSYGGGGGGAGGYLASSTTIYSGATYVVTVGAGGAGTGSRGNGVSGSNSVLSGTGLTTLTSIGGGGAGGDSAGGSNGQLGGSGGGGGGENKTGGSATSGQGNAGGGSNTSGINYGGGGGGGSSAVGSTPSTATGGNGGNGTASSISGSSVTYAGGGGGGGETFGGGTGGTGGGGAGGGGAGVSGTANTGSGGGGGGGAGGVVSGGAGGSGVVIISYAGSQVFNGGLVTSSGGNTIHTFNATGALTPVNSNLNNSLRFRGSVPAYLSRTPTVAGNRKTWTFSCWIKRGLLTGSQTLFGASNSGTTQFIDITINGNNVIEPDILDSNLTRTIRPGVAVFRDPSAWYHIVVAIDTTQATDTNRIKLYVNGNETTTTAGTGTYPAQNADTQVNATTGVHNIGRRQGSLDRPFDGYMTDINFIDGQALEPYYFGNNDAYGNWKPIQYKGTYGTNGFYLNFADTSALTTSSNAGLGKDTSGNGNYYATNNVSITAGVTYDAMLDVPTNTSATVANYAIVNPLDIAGTPTISDGNLKLTNGSAAWGASRTGFAMTSGKWYWEVTIISANTATNGICLGIANSSTQTAGYVYANQWVYNNNSGGGRKGLNGTSSAYGVTYVANDIVGIAFDADAGSITFYVNNSSQGVMASTGLPNPAFPYTETYSSDSVAVNFGQRPFTYTAPSGYVALNTYNLSTPTILQGNLYMDASLYTGDGSSSLTAVNQAQFKPDFVWLKSRSAATDHKLFDSVRGVQKQLTVNTGIETTQTTALSAFNTNGFTIGALANVNTSAATYVGWQWQAGQGTTTVNSSGATSSNVSVNSTAGFSIVTYTGTGANTTIGHGLSSAPKMVIVKNRGSAVAWTAWHTSIANTQYLVLNTDAAAATGATWWNSTTPTSSVISVGTSTSTNASGNTYVAYCWAEIAGFSKFGSYDGNGSADGPFVYTGFRPKYIMFKNSSAVSDWHIEDTSRDTYNVANKYLLAQDSGAEGTYTCCDILSNGFKLRNGSSSFNPASQTVIFMAFAENPFRNSLAR